MKNKIISLIILSFISLPAFSRNLIDYRKEFYSDINKEIEQNIENKIFTIRQLIGTDSHDNLDALLDSDLFNISQNVGENKSPETSGFFKNKLNDAVIEVLNDEKLGTPSSFNPEWSIETYRQEKMNLRAKKVMSILNQGKIKNVDNIPISPITALISALNEKVIKVKKNKGKTEISNPKQVEQMKKALVDYIENNSPKKKDESINDLLGAISNIKVVEGVVHEINFIKDDVEVPLKLSMLMTFKSEEDDFYVEIQNILINYLKEQNNIFSKQIGYMKESSFEVFLKNRLKLTINYWKDFFKGNLNTSSVNAYRHDIERKTNLERTKYFLEGVDLTGDKLISYMNKRIKLNNEVLPYLIKVHEKSHEINLALKKLSDKQINFLLDLTLRLRKLDLVSDLELAGSANDEEALNFKIYNKISDIKQSIKELDNSDHRQKETLRKLVTELDTDYYFYKIQGDQLYRLERSLKTNQAIKRAQQIRIKNL